MKEELHCGKNLRRRQANETNQSIKSERHRNVGIISDNRNMCRGVLEALSDSGASDIHRHIVDVCSVRRSYGRAEYLVE